MPQPTPFHDRRRPDCRFRPAPQAIGRRPALPGGGGASRAAPSIRGRTAAASSRACASSCTCAASRSSARPRRSRWRWRSASRFASSRWRSSSARWSIAQPRRVGAAEAGTPTTHREVAAHLALDLAAFSVLLLARGRHRESVRAPLSAARRADRDAAAVAARARRHAARRRELRPGVRFAEPLRYRTASPLSDATMALGLCASFALTAAVTAWFIVRIVATLREHDRLLREAARRALNDEAVLRIGTLAAGAAHELGTPLTTMAVVVGEMRRDATRRRRSGATSRSSPRRSTPAGRRSPICAPRRATRASTVASASRSMRSSGRRSRGSGRLRPDVTARRARRRPGASAGNRRRRRRCGRRS